MKPLIRPWSKSRWRTLAILFFIGWVAMTTATVWMGWELKQHDQLIQQLSERNSQ